MDTAFKIEIRDLIGKKFFYNARDTYERSYDNYYAKIGSAGGNDIRSNIPFKIIKMEGSSPRRFIVETWETAYCPTKFHTRGLWKGMHTGSKLRWRKCTTIMGVAVVLKKIEDGELTAKRQPKIIKKYEKKYGLVGPVKNVCDVEFHTWEDDQCFPDDKERFYYAPTGDKIHVFDSKKEYAYTFNTADKNWKKGTWQRELTI